MKFETALKKLSRNDRFKATVYAINTLLIQKGIYTTSEFEELFCEWAVSRSRDKVLKAGARQERAFDAPSPYDLSAFSNRRKPN